MRLFLFCENRFFCGTRPDRCEGSAFFAVPGSLGAYPVGSGGMGSPHIGCRHGSVTSYDGCPGRDSLPLLKHSLPFTGRGVDLGPLRNRSRITLRLVRCDRWRHENLSSCFHFKKGFSSFGNMNFQRVKTAFRLLRKAE